MGMDISGLNPKIIGDEPVFPKDWDTLSDKAKKYYMELDKEFHDNNPGKYFRANIWAWRPIHLACTMAVEALDMNVDTSSWAYNSGDGLKDQDECNSLAQGLEDMVEQMKEDGLERIGFNMGHWSDDQGNIKINEKHEKELNKMYSFGQLVKHAPIEIDGIKYNPSHLTEITHFEQFIRFLRNCGGFEIY
jgi:hypothetical protein